jgi:hypothetical protein
VGTGFRKKIMRNQKYGRNRRQARRDAAFGLPNSRPSRMRQSTSLGSVSATVLRLV